MENVSDAVRKVQTIPKSELTLTSCRLKGKPAVLKPAFELLEVKPDVGYHKTDSVASYLRSEARVLHSI